MSENWKPRFFLIWSGQAASLIGSALTQFVLIWWITQTSGSPSALAMASMMALLPQAIFGPLGGILADRWSRRLILIGSDLISALCMAVLIWLFASEQIQVWHLYTMMAIRSTMQAFQTPAAAASTSQLVPPDWLERAAGMNQAVMGLMSIAAAPLGALALSTLPLYGALMIDLFTVLLAITPLFFYQIPQPKRTDTQELNLWDDFRLGLRLVSQHGGLMRLYAVTVFMVAVLMPAFALMPLIVRNEFGGGVNDVAIMEGFAGVGMILGGLLIGFIRLRYRRITVILAAFAVSSITLAFAGLAPASMFWLAVVFWFISGLTYTFGHAPVMAIIQTIVPNNLQGRSISLFSTLMGIAGPLGLLFTGPLSEWLGLRGLLIWGGLLATAICLGAYASPRLMGIESENFQDQKLKPVLE